MIKTFYWHLLTFSALLFLTTAQNIMVGGYTSMSNLQDQGLVQASNFALSKNQMAKDATIVKAQRQIVSGINYRIFYSQSNGGQYQADVYVPLSGVMRLNNFMVLKSPNGTTTDTNQGNPASTSNHTTQNPSLPPQNANNASNSSNSQSGSFPPIPTLPPILSSQANSSNTTYSTYSNPSVSVNTTVTTSEISPNAFPSVPITTPTLQTPVPVNNTIKITSNVSAIGLPPVSLNDTSQNSEQALLQPTPYVYGSTLSNPGLAQPQSNSAPTLPQNPSIPLVVSQSGTNTSPSLLPSNITLPPTTTLQNQSLPQLPIQTNTNQQPTLSTPLYPILTQPTPYQYSYAQSSQQGTLNLTPTPNPPSPTTQPIPSSSTNPTRGCEMMDSSNTRCIICKGGFYLGTKGLCGIADPSCLRYNPQDYSCLVCLNGFSFNGNYCSS